MEKILADTKSYPLMYALAGLYTGKDLVEANDMVREALAKVLEPGEPMTAEHAGAPYYEIAGRRHTSASPYIPNEHNHYR